MDNQTIKKIQNALEKGKQPCCPYCGELLTVIEDESVEVVWEWNDKQGKYIKNVDEYSAEPRCQACQTEDFGFIVVKSLDELFVTTVE